MSKTEVEVFTSEEKKILVLPMVNLLFSEGCGEVIIPCYH